MTTEADRENRELDAGALRALAHPIRIRIYDILSQRSPQTASSLAEHLGESSGSTSYHLRALAKHDLIREVEGKGSGRERWWERPRGAISLGAPSAVRTPAGRAASQIVSTEFYRQRHDQLMAFLDHSMRHDSDETDANLITANARLTAAQFAELSAAMTNLIDDAVRNYRDQEGDGVRPYMIRLDLFPLDAQDNHAPQEEEER